MVKNKRFYLELLGLKTEDFEPNPRYKEKNQIVRKSDCLIRASCKLFDQDWDTVFKDMAKTAFEEKSMVNCIQIVTERYFSERGYKFNYDIEETVGEYIYGHKREKFLIGTRDHIVCVINGIIYDTSYLNKNVDILLITPVRYVVTKKES